MRYKSAMFEAKRQLQLALVSIRDLPEDLQVFCRRETNYALGAVKKIEKAIYAPESDPRPSGSLGT